MGDENTKMIDKPVKPNGFDKYSVYIMAELKRLGDVTERFDEQNGKQHDEIKREIHDGFDKVYKEISALKVVQAVTERTLNLKSGIWAAIAGLIPSIAVAIYVLTRFG